MATSVLSETGENISPVSIEMAGASQHNVILQTLDAFFPSPLGKDGMLFYGVENFEPTRENWNGKPFIFCGVYPPEHIDYQEYLANPVKTLQKIDGRPVGVHNWTTVITEGSKRLETTATIWDAKCQELLRDGRLGVSTDFDCPYSEDHLTGIVTPNYTLVWEMQIANEQNDRGARFMNTDRNSIVSQETEKMSPDTEIKDALIEQKGILSGILDAIKGLGRVGAHANTADVAPVMSEFVASPIAPAVPVEYLEKMTAIESEKAAIAEKAQALEAKVAEFETSEATRLEAEKAAGIAALETEWQTTVMPKLPKGLLHEEAKAQEVKDLYIADARAFMRQYGDMLNKTEVVLEQSGNMPNTAKGQTHANSTTDADACPVLGSFDAMKGGFV